MTIDGWFIASIVVGMASTIICFVAAVMKKKPNDLTLISLAVVEIFIIVYAVASLIRVLAGANINGEPWEFWGYILTAALLPVGGFYWAMTERTFWSNYVMGAVGVTVVVMMARMAQIWYGVSTAAQPLQLGIGS
ncbi:hypothetical protein [Arthrobacter cryoconiti]|uniref:Integral membrane protein n=1 Tax=Arthrobacter cryoconiti TaxID=748907 RepID=A0ABV8R2C4_9MICC